jgi:hypothetical protein
VLTSGLKLRDRQLNTFVPTPAWAAHRGTAHGPKIRTFFPGEAKTIIVFSRDHLPSMLTIRDDEPKFPMMNRRVDGDRLPHRRVIALGAQLTAMQPYSTAPTEVLRSQLSIERSNLFSSPGTGQTGGSRAENRTAARAQS